LQFVSLQFMSQYIKIGKFVASHGLNGELILVHNLGKKSDLKDLQVIFVAEVKDSFLPYFVEKATAKSITESYVKLESVNSKESTRRFYPKEVWLTEEDFKKYAAPASPISLLGYNLIDGENDLGEIIEVLEQPHQLLCTIMYKGNEALIPIHDDNLIKMDAENKKVHVDIPDGLLEIYAE
jgi:16S rRNA processing protein RimM